MSMARTGRPDTCEAACCRAGLRVRARRGKVAAPGQTTEGRAPESPQAQAPTVDICPAASPDGRTVVFVRNRELWAIDASGGNERLLAKPDTGSNDMVHTRRGRETVG